jgi:hypothetical protein
MRTLALIRKFFEKLTFRTRSGGSRAMCLGYIAPPPATP